MVDAARPLRQRDGAGRPRPLARAAQIHAHKPALVPVAAERWGQPPEQRPAFDPRAEEADPSRVGTRDRRPAHPAPVRHAPQRAVAVEVPAERQERAAAQHRHVPGPEISLRHKAGEMADAAAGAEEDAFGAPRPAVVHHVRDAPAPDRDGIGIARPVQAGELAGAVLPDVVDPPLDVAVAARGRGPWPSSVRRGPCSRAPLLCRTRRAGRRAHAACGRRRRASRAACATPSPAYRTRAGTRRCRRARTPAARRCRGRSAQPARRRARGARGSRTRGRSERLASAAVTGTGKESFAVVSARTSRSRSRRGRRRTAEGRRPRAGQERRTGPAGAGRSGLPAPPRSGASPRLTSTTRISPR